MRFIAIPVSASNDVGYRPPHHPESLRQLFLMFSGPVSLADFVGLVHRQLHAAPISALHGSRCPSAVSGLVPSRIVDAVQSRSRRPCPHVGEEVRERRPPLANLDPPAAVVLEVAARRGIASVVHPVPGDVLGRSVHAVRIPRIARASPGRVVQQGTASFLGRLRTETAAGPNRNTPRQKRRCDGLFITASASAKPCEVAVRSSPGD